MQVLEGANGNGIDSLLGENLDLALLQSLPTKAADGFLLHPAVSQAALMDCGLHDFVAKALMPNAGSCILLPINASTAGAATWSKDCETATLSTPHGSKLVAVFSGLQHTSAEEVQPFRPILQPLSTGFELLYHTEWQALESLPAVDSSALPHQDSRVFSGLFQQNDASQPASRLALTAITAGANFLKVLQTRERSLLHLSLCTAGAEPAQTPAPGGLAIGAAVMAGVLRTVPLEMPRLGVQLQDFDSATACLPGECNHATIISMQTGAPTVGSAHTDVHGSVARARSLYLPRLQYTTSLPGMNTCGSMPSCNGHQGCFVVTGGLGGLGMMASSWLANYGIRSLVLVSRTGISAAGTTIVTSLSLVEMSKADVAFLSDAKQVACAAHRLQYRHDGILHAAGLQVSYWQKRTTVCSTNLGLQDDLDQGSYSDLSSCCQSKSSCDSCMQFEARLKAQAPGTLRQVFAPKLNAVQSCHAAAPAASLSLSLLFSSVSSIAGSAGHANYAAANVVLDVLAECQGAAGRPVVAVQWGAWASAGRCRHTGGRHSAMYATLEVVQ